MAGRSTGTMCSDRRTFGPWRRAAACFDRSRGSRHSRSRRCYAAFAQTKRGLSCVVTGLVQATLGGKTEEDMT